MRRALRYLIGKYSKRPKKHSAVGFYAPPDYFPLGLSFLPLSFFPVDLGLGFLGVFGALVTGFFEAAAFFPASPLSLSFDLPPAKTALVIGTKNISETAIAPVIICHLRPIVVVHLLSMVVPFH